MLKKITLQSIAEQLLAMDTHHAAVWLKRRFGYQPSLFASGHDWHLTLMQSGPEGIAAFETMRGVHENLTPCN